MKGVVESAFARSERLCCFPTTIISDNCERPYILKVSKGQSSQLSCKAGQPLTVSEYTKQYVGRCVDLNRGEMLD